MLPKKELEHATDVDKFNLAAESTFIALKDEIDKLNINSEVNVPTSWIFFKPPASQPHTSWSTNHQTPTNKPLIKCTDYRPTDHRPIRSLRTRNSITNFKWISDEKMWRCVTNITSRKWGINFWLKWECVIDKTKIKVKLFKYKTYHRETAFE